MMMKKAVILTAVFAVAFLALPAAAATNILRLGTSEAAGWDATHVLALDAADLTTEDTNTAQTISFDVEAGTYVRFMGMKLNRAFDSTDTNYTHSLAVKVGDGADDDFFLASTELAADGTEVWTKRVTAHGGTITITPQTDDVEADPVLTLQYNGANVTNVSVATTTYSVMTNATATFSASQLGEKYYAADDTVDVVLTPNEEYGTDDFASGSVDLYFRITTR
jgi:hypothetical protein